MILPAHHTAIHPADSAFTRALVTCAFFAIACILPALAMKRWVAEALVITVGLCFLIQSATSRDWAWIRTPIMITTLVLWAYLLAVVTPLALDTQLSLSRSSIWWRYPLFFAAIVFWLTRYPDKMLRLCQWMAFVIGLVVLDTYIQYFTGTSLTGMLRLGNRLTGPLTKAVVGIFLSKISMPIIGLLLYTAWTDGNRRLVGVYFLFLTAVTGAIAFSNERTALITYLTGLAFVTIFIGVRLTSARKLLLIFALSQILLLGCIYSTQQAMHTRVNESVQQLGKFSASPYAQVWKASWEIWKEYPFTGAGLKNFRVACPDLMEQGVVSYCDLHSHNVYLEWLSETGLIGLGGFVAFLIFYAAMILRKFRHTSAESTILLGFATAALFPTYFPVAATQSFFANWPAMLAWFSMALAAAIVQRVTPYER